MESAVERFERIGLTRRQAIRAVALEHKVDETKLRVIVSSDPLPR